MPESSPAGNSPGPAIDRTGAPVIDPTKNVQDLVDAAVLRLDDLRIEATSHTRELMSLHFKYQDQLRNQEAERINAIRAVDVGAVQRAAEVQAAAAATLATQVQVSAETLRNQVLATAVASTTALSTALQPITKSIEDLRQAQFTQQGEKTRGHEGTTNNQWMIGLGLTVVAVLTAIAPHIKFS